jgi:hypothetical protein
MPSICPKCHKVLEEDEICCAQVQYTWRCKTCFKLGTGVAVPYGNCFMCGGKLEVIPDRDLGDSMRFHAIHDAMQFELSSFHFFRLARERATRPEQCLVLERLYEAGLDHLYDLEGRYHAHLDSEMVELATNEEKLFSDWPFRGIQLTQDPGVIELYKLALETEQRAREHFRQLASEFPAGLENELCKEVVAEEDEYVAMLETELAQIT